MSTRPNPIPTRPGVPEQGQGPAGLDAKTPLLLLPVHIQTRFVDPVGELSKGAPELWVRIYPDQIAVDSHEPELTSQEVSDGQVYWSAVWQAGKTPAKPDDSRAPWRVLAALYGSPRAAWIAQALTPTNQAAQPSAPTPAGTAVTPTPVFPVVPLRDSSWTKAATADALPDAWTVVLIAGGKSSIYRGGPMTPSLAVNLTPNAGAFPAGSSVDAGLQWMVDFNAAVAAGMALRIPLTAAQRSGGFDQIFVYGLRSTDNTANQTFARLLDAHHYTDGFALVPPGSATNNTPDAPSSYSRKDPDFELSFATERSAPLTTNPNCDGQTFAAALGIVPTHLDHVAAADNTGALNGADMLRSLWPATLGYFLSQMMADTFTPEIIEEARQYALAYAVPRGPVPSFRVGRTPYGVLPVTSLANYQSSPDLPGQITKNLVEPNLVSFVRKLWPTWLGSSTNAPHMQRGGDPDQNLMSVLGIDASSMNFQGRPVLGNAFIWNYLNFFGAPKAFQGQFWQDYQLPGKVLLQNYGYAWNPRVLTLGFDEKSFPVEYSTVQEGALSETDPLNADADLGAGVKGNYINWLAVAPIADIQAENYPGPKPTSLLYKILRQSLLLAYSNLAGMDEVRSGKLTIAQVQETEIVGIQKNVITLTPWQVLARPSTPNPALTWADYLLTKNFAAGSSFAQLNDIRASLARLPNLPTAELDRLLTETLDSCSHRLDVWATAIANALLKRTRNSQNNAVLLGCYGWVEDVRPEADRVPVQGAELQRVQQLDRNRQQKGNPAANLPVPLQPVTDSGGYIYAPSQAQAAVAAVLRNGHMTHKGTAEEGLLSIDLSSERVRKALSLISGVQQGQSLNALLGFLFEDALHDQSLDIYVQPFRDAYPLVGNKVMPSSDPTESIAAPNVVDGLALRTAWDGGKLASGQSWGTGLPTLGFDQNKVITILQTLDDYADALGDLSMAEAVFQIIRGNFGRGGGLMNAISQGSRPPNPDVVDTPRGGIDLTHRVAVLLAGAPGGNPAWGGTPQHPRAASEPWLDAWVGQLLPDPANVRCEVQSIDSSKNPQSKIIALSDLKAGPLDLLALSDAAEVPQRSELENRILYVAALPATSTNIQIVFQSVALPAGSVLFPDALFLAQTVRRFLGACRPFEPQDLTTPENNAAKAGGAIDLAELKTRATAMLAKLDSDIGALQTALMGFPGSTGPIRDALIQCSWYGVTGSIPNTTSGPDAALSDQAPSVIKELQVRWKKGMAPDLTKAQFADYQGIFKAVFANDFAILPHVTPPDLATLQAAFGQSATLTAADPEAPARWFRQVAHVRPGISRLDLALSVAQAFSTNAIYPPALSLAQLPPVPAPDRWLALPLDPTQTPQKGRVALACVTTGNPTVQATYAGLVVDEWPERIPNAQAQTAVAFHFEEPAARAPQALLLAVCPDNRASWDDALLQAVLAETLELAKIRTVDLNSMQRAGQILPALYFALNLANATVSTRFAVLRENINNAVAAIRSGS
jgi:hypothetical protein